MKTKTCGAGGAAHRARDKTVYSLFLRYLLIVLIPIAVLLMMGTISILINQKYVSRQIVESNSRAVEQIRNSFDLTFDELDSLAVSFSASPQFLQALESVITSKRLTLQQSLVLTTISDFINVSAYARPYIYSIYVYIDNPGEKLLTTTDGIVNRRSYYDRSWYHDLVQHRAGDMEWAETRILTPLHNNTDRVRVLSIFRRIYSLSGFRVPGAVVLNIDQSYVDGVIDRLKVSPIQRIAVFDASDRLLAGGFPRGVRPASLPKPSQFAVPSQHIIHAGGTSYFEIDLTSARSGWTYASFTPLPLFYRSSFDLRNMNIAVVVLSFLIGSLLTLYASRRSFRQIESVVDVVMAGDGGRPLPPVPDKRDKGFGQITYAILRTFVEHKYLTVQLSERKYRSRTLELLALHSQLNPHFLFNTLETINWKIIQAVGGPSTINEMIGALSRVLSYSLQSPFELETFHNEIKHTKDYLAIQKSRYKEKFTVRWRCDDGLDEYKVIRFLLQPLIENSIYHGIKEAPGNHVIEITIRKVPQGIHLEVWDDGKGIEAKRLEEINRSLAAENLSTENIGLYNTNKRIQLAFGEHFGLRVESSEGVGTGVFVDIPAKI